MTLCFNGFEYEKKIIFIAGADHSGSTLLGCILGAYYGSVFKYFHVGEIHAFFKEKNKRFGDPKNVRNLLYGEIWDKVDHTVGYENAYKEIFKISNAEAIIDSSKTYWNFKAIKSGCLENGYNLHVVISLRPFAKIFQSDLKRKKSEKNIINNICRYFDIKNKIIDQDYSYTIVNTEELILDSCNVTKKLCEAVKIPYFEGKENYWNYPNCHLYGGKTQRLHLKNSSMAGYDKERVLTEPDISHSFLEREDVRDVENFFMRNSL